MQFSTISLIGLGYIGLPTAALLASRMGNVVGVDVNSDVVESITNGNVKTLEPGLTELLAQVSGSALRAVTKPETADAFIIAVPTPITEDHKPDISYVRSAALSLAPVLRTGNLIILESTSPVGTTEQMAQWLAEARPDLSFPQQAGDEADVQIAYCPERILPGKMLEELIRNDRIVGGLTRTASGMAATLYRLFVEGEIHITSVRTAELCKLAENSFRDVNIAYANELSMICDKLDIDVQELISLANHHPRVNILQPGCGVGGHCIPVDPWFIVDSAPEQAKLIRTAREVNISKTNFIVEKIISQIKKEIKENFNNVFSTFSVGFLGVSFKPDCDDMRESAALYIVQQISMLGCKVFVADPHIRNIDFINSNIIFTTSDIVLKKATIVYLLTKHSCFRKINKLNYIQIS